MKLLKTWWWVPLVIFAITYVIWREEEHCQTQANECRAEYSAQARSDRSIFWLTPDQRAAEQQTIAAACEPNGYFCRLFGPANLPSVILVFVGIGGIWAAVQTLRNIARQTNLMHRSLVFQLRSRIIIRQMSLNSGDDPAAPKWKINATIFNSGGTQTTIKSTHIVVFYEIEPHIEFQGGKPVDPNPKSCKQDIKIPGETILKAGDGKDISLDLDAEMSERLAHLDRRAKTFVTNPRLVGLIYLRGEIQCIDEIGDQRTIGISRELDFPTKRFTVSDDSDFEYAD